MKSPRARGTLGWRVTHSYRNLESEATDGGGCRARPRPRNHDRESNDRALTESQASLAYLAPAESSESHSLTFGARLLFYWQALSPTLSWPGSPSHNASLTRAFSLRLLGQDAQLITDI